MESEERPSKLRRVDVPDAQSDVVADAPLLPELIDSATGSAPTSTPPTSKPHGTAANVADSTSDSASAPTGEASKSNGTKFRYRDPDPAEHERMILQHQQDPNSSVPLSKNQLKKLRRREEWEAARADRKLKRKEKIQEKKIRKKEAKQEEEERLKLLLEQSTAEGDQNGDIASKILPATAATQTANPKSKQRSFVKLPITILIDCGFDNLMMEKERISLGSQITRAYSDNHRAPYQAHLVFSSWGGQLKHRFDTVLNKHHLNWKNVRLVEEDFVHAAREMDEIMRDPKKGGRMVGPFTAAQSNNAQVDEGVSGLGKTSTRATTDDGATRESHKPESTETPPSLDDSQSRQASKTLATQDLSEQSAKQQAPSSTAARPQGEVVYLTSDSPHTLSTLSPYSTYIVGGLVDKNRHKGICYKTACDRGIKTAKLPIGEYLDMSSRKVLTTNHVVEILLRWLEEAADGKEEGAWGRAFLRVIPKRKGGRLREVGEDNENEAGNDVEQEHEEGDEEEVHEVPREQ
jgi:tRNA (guanine9-N1)-methyltransferase